MNLLAFILILGVLTLLSALRGAYKENHNLRFENSLIRKKLRTLLKNKNLEN